MIPREVDELMWNVAESGDPHAISEFGDRYPNLREELLKRMKTVQALKGSGHNVRSTVVPRFRNPQTTAPNWRIFSFVAVGMALVVICFATIRYAMSGPTPTPQVHAINVEAANLPQAAAQRDDTPQKLQPQGPGETSPRPKGPHLGYVPSGESRRTDLQLDQASLHYAIFAVAEKGNLQCTIAPGLADPTIHVDLRGMTPMEMLKALGQQYAFDTLLDGDHAVVIVPKKDEKEEVIANNETR